jgi:uncharacterized membrane protein YeaQ/YmgE (transglycosylase-associated protein family)
MNIILYLIIGAAAGWLAGQLVRGHGFGLWSDLVVGMLGAILGGFLLSLLGVGTYSLLGNLMMSTAGAVVLLAAMRIFTGPAKR